MPDLSIGADVVQLPLDDAVGNPDGQTHDPARAALEAAGRSDVVHQMAQDVVDALEAEAADTALIEVLPTQDANGSAEDLSTLRETLESVQETLKASQDAELEVIRNVSDADDQGSAIEAVAVDDDALLVVDSDTSATADHAVADHQTADDHEETDTA